MMIRQMKIEDYQEIYSIWKTVFPDSIRRADDYDQIERYLKRNDGVSQVALMDNKIVGTILGGHDGRRGFIHHMAVLTKYRNKGIARKLVNACLQQLKKEGIDRCHLFVFSDNRTVQQVWETLGWNKREDLLTYTYVINEEK